MTTKQLLNRINFNKILSIDHDDIDNYSFQDYENNSFKHKIKGFCTLCEKANCYKAKTDDSFFLQTIGHGAHSLDFLQAFNQEIDFNDWHDDGVLFLFETPSGAYDFYTPIKFKGITKKPTSEWYFVHERIQNCEYPEHFVGNKYGKLIASIIVTFKLKNAYMTDLVKCGLNNNNGEFKNMDHMKSETISNCYKNYMEREIRILSPKVIFTFGSNVTLWLKNNLNKIPIFDMPHPTGGRRGFKDTFFNTLYFWIVAKALYQTKIISDNELHDLTNRFANN